MSKALYVRQLIKESNLAADLKTLLTQSARLYSKTTNRLQHLLRQLPGRMVGNIGVHGSTAQVQWMGSRLTVLCLFSSRAAIAQIIPDATLPVNSIITPQDNATVITGGTAAGGNLFHSFVEFNVPTGETAFFNSDPAVQNIITRVTGSFGSNIQGILSANGGANLFLLNPNGIIFGPNAQLGIGGSFVASTANGLNFADGNQFSVTNPQAPPLLTVSVPIGLQLGVSPGAIVNQSRAAASGLSQPGGLAVQPGKTLALVGGDVLLQGGHLTASGGRIELVSVRGNSRSLVNGSSQVPTEYGDIQLSQGAAVDASGMGGGTIQVQGDRVTLADGSRLVALTLGSQPGGAIAVDAADSVEITGTGEYEQVVRRFVAGTVGSDDLKNGFFTLSLGSGSAGSILINTPNFIAQNGAFVAASTFGPGKGGNVTVNASSTVQLSASFVATGTGVGNAGDAANLTINTGDFRAQQNAVGITSSFGAGQGGNLIVNARNSVELIGSNPIPLAANVRVLTGFFTSSLGTGNAGDLRLETDRLVIREGAGLAASAFFQGQGGNIAIRAFESVELIGTSPNTQALSSVAAVTEPGAIGNGGNITIDTPQLILQDGGRVSVRSRGTGRTGNLEVIADSIFIENQSGFEGTAVSGEGANISVRSRDLQLRGNSFISATAGGAEGGSGNGGNITISSDTLEALEDSDITANAFSGTGGNIYIQAQGIFRSADSTLEASSQLGINGVVQVKTPAVELHEAFVQLSGESLDPERVLASSCLARRNSDRGSFIVTGTGGLPNTPFEAIAPRYSLTRVQSLSSQAQSPSFSASPGESSPSNRVQVTFNKLWKLGEPIQEAHGIVITPDGRTLLGMMPTQVAEANTQEAICPAD